MGKYLAAVFAVLVPVSSLAQNNIYIVTQSGNVLRWSMTPPAERPGLPPQWESVPDLMPRISGIDAIGSIAVDPWSVAYVNTGHDGDIYRTDGRTATRIYRHPGQVRQLAFGRSHELLFFSVVPAAQASSGVRDGQIYVLNLLTGQAEPRYSIAQQAVGRGWWGAFTVDLNDRVFLGTDNAGIYELRSGTPALVYDATADNVGGLAFVINEIYYTTNRPEVTVLRNFQDRGTTRQVPGEGLLQISYTPFPMSDEIRRPACTLTIELRRGELREANLYAPVVRGPNLYWNARDYSSSSRRDSARRFTYFLEPGMYWVAMDSKTADSGRTPRPAEQRVNCRGSRAQISFSF